MKKYPAFKDAGVAWMGVIPAHWEKAALKRVVSTKITDGPHTTPEFLDTGIPFISAEAVVDGKVDFGKMRGYISEATDEEFSKKCKPQKEDVFIVKSGSTTGKIAYVDFDDNFNIWSPIALVRCNKTKAIGRFIYYSLNSKYFQKQIQLNWSFGTQPNIGMGIIENLIVILPESSEQTAIAHHLDQKTALLDTLLRQSEKMIALLQEQRTALINHAVTKGLTHLPPERGGTLGVPVKESGVEWIGEVPEHWETTKFKYAIQFQEGPGILAQDFRDEGVPLIRISGIKGKYASLDGCNYLDSNKVNLIWPHFKLEKEDILISCSASTDLVSEVNNEVVGAIAYTGIIRLTPIIGKTTKDFIKNIVKSAYYQSQIDLQKTGSTIQHYGPSHLSKMFIFIPPISEQTAIAHYLDQKTTEIATLIQQEERRMELLREYRSALISEVVTGKICVL